ncbi:MAG: hypothetical protein IKA87_00220 [Lentisphaeria bacterium]|nr:hypothetical protein [Lentisphaeria bacterium]
MKIKFKRTNCGAAVLAAILCMVIQVLVTMCRDGGNLHFESVFFMMNYLDGRPLLNQIMDPGLNDWGFYQAREFSYLFDAIDAHVVAFLLSKHIVWFHSLCSILLCGVMIFIQHYFSRRFFPAVPGMAVTLMSVFFVLSAGVAAPEYFRCAKFLTAAGLWGACFASFAMFRFGGWKSKTALIVSLLVMTLSDRQGFFFTAAMCGTAGVLLLFMDHYGFSQILCRRGRQVILTAFGVTVFGIINNLLLTPLMIKCVNGYIPDFSYQKGVSLQPGNLTDGFLFLTGNAGNWFSNYTGDLKIAAVSGVLLFLGMALELWREHRKGMRRSVCVTVLWGCAVTAMILCGALMASRHPMIMAPGVVYGTYAVNFMVISLFLAAFTAAGAGKRFCMILICLLAAGIILRLGGEFAGEKFNPGDDFFTGYNSGQYVLKSVLRDPGFDEKKYCLPRRMELFLEFYRKNILTKK